MSLPFSPGRLNCSGPEYCTRPVMRKPPFKKVRGKDPRTIYFRGWRNPVERCGTLRVWPRPEHPIPAPGSTVTGTSWCGMPCSASGTPPPFGRSRPGDVSCGMEGPGYLQGRLLRKDVVRGNSQAQDLRLLSTERSGNSGGGGRIFATRRGSDVFQPGRDVERRP